MARKIFIDLAPLRESRDFRLLFVGQLVSTLGSQLTLVAIPFQIYSETHSSLQVGLVSTAQLVPLVVFSLIGGSVGDAVDRRLLILLSTLGLTLAYYVVNTVVFWLVLMSISPSINPVIALSLPLIIIMGNVPISISGLGVRELVSVTVFSAFGDSAAYGFSASLILYLLTSLLPGLVGSLFTLGGVRPYEAEKREL